MNFWRDVVQNAPPDARALVELTREGSRREYTFGALAGAAARLAGTLDALGVRRGEVVLTLVGNRLEWALTMLACFRQGFVVLPCTEQLRPKDLAQRLRVAQPRIVVADERNQATLREAGWSGDTLWVPLEADASHTPAPAELAPEDPCLITFTSGTAGEPKAVLHGQRYLTGQQLQAAHWLAPKPGRLVWCTAAAGWSKSARNAFIAPWICGAAALLHDARFDPAERLELIARERVDVLCMAPTEYRVIAKRAELRRFDSLRGLVAAGEALNPEVLHAWHDAIGLWIRDGYGQTETGQLTGAPPGETPRPGSMGKPLPGVRLDVVDGELVLHPHTDPTFFLHYLGDEPHAGVWHTGDSNRTANIATPIVHNGHVFLSSDYGTGAALLKLTPENGAVRATQVYFTMEMKNHYSTSVLVGEYLYGYSSSILTAMKFLTGEVAWRDRSVGKGVVIYADRHLYAFGEGGVIGLIEATPTAYKEKSRFEISKGDFPTWTPPVISGGKLYIREQDNLYCYNIKR